MTHKVGQVVYLLDNSEMKIFPARIEEEIIKRKLGSEDVSYKVLLPDKAQTVVDLGELDVAVFTSVAELRDHMVGNAVRTIDRFIERSKKVAETLEIQNQGLEDPVRDDDTMV